MNTAKENTILISLINIANIDENRKKKLIEVLPQANDLQKLELARLLWSQIYQKVNQEIADKRSTRMEKFVKHPVGDLFDELETADKEAWQAFASKLSGSKDQSQIDDVRGSLQALQEKLKKISSYAEEAQTVLGEHLTKQQ